MNLRYGLGLLGLLSAVTMFLMSLAVGFPNEPLYLYPWDGVATAGLLLWVVTGLAAAGRLCLRGQPARLWSLLSLVGFALYLYAGTHHASAFVTPDGEYLGNAETLFCVGLLSMAIFDLILPSARGVSAVPAVPERFRAF
jgi:hypothetical protein